MTPCLFTLQFPSLQAEPPSQDSAFEPQSCLHDSDLRYRACCIVAYTYGSLGLHTVR